MAPQPQAGAIVYVMGSVACEAIISVLEICVGLLNIIVGIVLLALKKPADLPVGICLVTLGVIFILSSLYRLVFTMDFDSPRNSIRPQLIVVNLFKLVTVIIAAVFIFIRDPRNVAAIVAIVLSIIIYTIHPLKDIIGYSRRKKSKTMDPQLLS